MEADVPSPRERQRGIVRKLGTPSGVIGLVFCVETRQNQGYDLDCDRLHIYDISIRPCIGGGNISIEIPTPMSNVAGVLPVFQLSVAYSFFSYRVPDSQNTDYGTRWERLLSISARVTICLEIIVAKCSSFQDIPCVAFEMMVDPMSRRYLLLPGVDHQSPCYTSLQDPEYSPFLFDPRICNNGPHRPADLHTDLSARASGACIRKG